jgi:hypothetical protein
MKHIVTACFILVLALLMLVSSDATAAIKIKVVGHALNDYPGSKWAISNGLRVVGVGSKVFMLADTTGSGETGGATWAFAGSLPMGSTTTLDSTNMMGTSFTTDVAGFYYVTVTVGASTARDTIYASTYGGVASTADAGCSCHNGSGFAPGNAADIKAAWQATGHAQIFSQGVTGNLEVDANINKGMYAKNCIQCHTVGWDPNLNNGNFGYLAHTLPAAPPNSWDSTWFAGLPLTADGRDVMITTGDSTIWKNLPTAMVPLATIGCESCHGPATGHKMGGGVGNFRQSIDKSFDAAVCNLCHNGSGRHSLGSYFNMSAHALPVSEQRVNCSPCHQGATFVKWIDNNKDTTGFAASVTADQLATPITCAACHDPHTAQLRDAAVDSLRNGFKFTPSGKSQVCSYCHSSRYSVTVRVTNTAPYYGFTNRYGPHGNPQYDMLVGGNGYEYDGGIGGLTTHAKLEDGCVTCHMQGRVRSGNTLPNHSFSMTDTTYGFKPITVCKECHGEVEDFNQIMAAYDYDGNGKIEGTQVEVQGLLNRLKAILPQDASGNPVTMMSDSLKVKNHPEYVQGIWDYYFVLNDGSMGVHNATYAVALLQKALGTYPLDVKPVGGDVPKTYALNQNYPNPFNPSTTISFALPKNEQVKLEVYDILGNLVKTMVNQQMGAGTYQVVWNGVDQNGARVASGVYLYRLQAGSFSTVKKMLMVK